jgi:hypothetical protein
MSDSYDDPGYAGLGGAGAGAGGGSSAGSGGGADRDFPAPTGFLRGVGVVIVAVVIGVLLLPSGTRAPLGVRTVSASTPPPASPTTTVPNSTTTTLATIVPGSASIHVLVANGTSITDLAGGTSTYLKSRGFLTLPATNSTTKVTGTQVYAVSGPSSSATTVTEALGLPASTIQPTSAVAPVHSTTGANVVVIAGPDLVRLAPTGTTTSTAGPTD